MNITYTDGRSVIKQYDGVEFREAILDPDCVTATVFMPGKVVTMSDRKYVIGPRGNYIRVKEGE